MKEYIIWYYPIWGQFTRYSQRVNAFSYLQAEMKFYGTSSADNCQHILEIEEL